MHGIFSGKGRLAIPGIGEAALDHRRSRPLEPEPLFLFIRCIDVHKKPSIPRRRCRSIQVADRFRLCQSMVRAGRPRSRGGFLP